MAPEPLDALRLTLMQDLLPVGMAVVERARQGGPRQVLAAFDGSSADPLGRLRQEGEPAASQLRDNLDRIHPGLGNPVVKVEVRDVVAEPPPTGTAQESGGTSASPSPATSAADATAEVAELQDTLARIAERLALLEHWLTGPGASAGRPPA